MPSPFQCRVVADTDIDQFQNRLNILLGQLISVPLCDDLTTIKVEYSTTVITTYPKDEDNPLQKPYYSVLVWFQGPVATPV